MFWFWFVVVTLAVIGWVIYSKRKNTLTIEMSTDQAANYMQFIGIEKLVIEEKMQDIVDYEALKGNTVSVTEMFQKIEAESGKDAHEYMEWVLENYGTVIPANTAHRIEMQILGCKMWSDNPGCFERHLQRRDGNPLFPPERRVVVRKEIEDARIKDKAEQNLYHAKCDLFHIKSKAAHESRDADINTVKTLLQEIMELIQDGAKYGESVNQDVEYLERLEQIFIDLLVDDLPESSDIFRRLVALSSLARDPSTAQYARPDSPIYKNEFIPTLLSEDLQYIHVAAMKCKGYDLDSRPSDADMSNHPSRMPNTADVRECLDRAIADGFSKERATEIMTTWNEARDGYTPKPHRSPST